MNVNKVIIIIIMFDSRFLSVTQKPLQDANFSVCLYYCV
jgi:hypothetical protein